MIPKVIHYCWFGRNPLPKLARKCIESWKKYCPDYEIIEWNEDNFDINFCDYVKEAYEAKKYAFVSDYARFKILYEHGGLYFDTDVEIIKSLDNIVEKGGFMGCENDTVPMVAPGLGLGVKPGLELYKELMDVYHSTHFLNEDGTFNQKTVVEYTTEVLQKHGLKDNGEIQEIAGIYIYPKEYFCPKDSVTRELNLTKNSVAIHHYDGSWMESDRKFVNLVTDVFGYRTTKVLIKIKHFLKGIKK